MTPFHAGVARAVMIGERFAAVMYVMLTGITWRHPPSELGVSPATAHRLKEWSAPDTSACEASVVDAVVVEAEVGVQLAPEAGVARVDVACERGTPALVEDRLVQRLGRCHWSEVCLHGCRCGGLPAAQACW